LFRAIGRTRLPYGVFAPLRERRTLVGVGGVDSPAGLAAFHLWRLAGEDGPGYLSPRTSCRMQQHPSVALDYTGPDGAVKGRDTGGEFHALAGSAVPSGLGPGSDHVAGFEHPLAQHFALHIAATQAIRRFLASSTPSPTHIILDEASQGLVDEYMVRTVVKMLSTLPAFGVTLHLAFEDANALVKADRFGQSGGCGAQSVNTLLGILGTYWLFFQAPASGHEIGEHLELSRKEVGALSRLNLGRRYLYCPTNNTCRCTCWCRLRGCRPSGPTWPRCSGIWRGRWRRQPAVRLVADDGRLPQELPGRSGVLGALRRGAETMEKGMESRAGRSGGGWWSTRPGTA